MSTPSVLLYCHDTYGLGHLKRTLTLSRHLRGHWPGLSQLIVTGSPLAHRFLLPEDVDYAKLPSVTKVGDDRYASRSLALPFDRLRDLRRDLILEVARHYRPDALVVDNVPAGLKGELLPTLEFIKRTLPRTRLVLGLRDIVDGAERVRRAWSRDGSYELLDEIYDLILVYGDRRVYDVVGEYGLSRAAAAKTRFVGYLRREAPAGAAERVRAGLGLRTNRLVLVTTGGGGDGSQLCAAALAAVGRRNGTPKFDCVLVGGPLMPTPERERLAALSAGSAAHFVSSVDDLTGYVAAADVVVSMGGYNSVCEILSLRRPAVLVPRVEPRTEQLVRARALTKLGLVSMIHPDELSPARLLTEIDALLAGSEASGARPALDGLGRTAHELGELLSPRRAA